MNDISIRFLIYTVIFLAVMLLIEGVYLFWRDVHGASKRVNRRLELIDKGNDRAEVLSMLRRARRGNFDKFGIFSVPLQRLDLKLTQAGLTISAPQFLAMTGGLALMVFLVAIFMTSTLTKSLVGNVVLLSFLFSLAIGFGIPSFILNIRRNTRIKKLQEQFPVALDVFVRGLRAGHPVSAALELLTHEMSDPLGSEFGIVVDETTYGLELRDALENMADRLGIEEMHMFVVSLSIQSETGGNLAEILDNLSKVIRERASMVMKVRALSSEGRMTALMLSALPVLAFTIVFVLSPKFYIDVAADPIFLPSVIAILGLYAFGIWLIRRMIDLKV